MKIYFGFTVAGTGGHANRKKDCAAARINGSRTADPYLVGDNAWPTLPERACRRLPRKAPRPTVCTAS